MKNALVAAALLLAMLGSAHEVTAANTAIAASSPAHLTTVNPADLGWGGALAPITG